MPHRFRAVAKAVVPNYEIQHIERITKVGKMAQPYDQKNHQLVQDFVMLQGPNSTHRRNAISPAFTASFELAHHIFGKYTVNIYKK